MLSDDFKLLVGLGNPGTEYEKTRHNVGFMVLEEIARKNNCSFRESKKLFGRTCEYGSGIEKTRLLMPNTYMNESGKSVRSAKDWFDFQNNQLIVLVDDMDLPLGRLRIREKGGSGGHNGLKSTIQHLKTENFCRLRIGIGSPSPINHQRKALTVSHVLGRFNATEKDLVEDVLNELLLGLELLQTQGLERAANYLNSLKIDLNN